MKTDLVVTGFIFHEDKMLLIHHKKLNLWLPVGGHIEPNEVPDDALKREIMEETNLEVDIPQVIHLPLVHDAKRNCATPFHVNVHSVGDHEHCGFDYICITSNPKALKLNNETQAFRWLTREEFVSDSSMREDVRSIILLAFDKYALMQR
jgi:ADP-ribose pyrophosphatase YjhB (NUDIX family)